MVTQRAHSRDTRSQALAYRVRAATIGLLKFCRNKPLGGFGLFVLCAMVFLAAAADWIAPYPPAQSDFMARFQAPLSDGHLLGTDRFGRDILSRVIHGSRISLYVGLASVFLGCGIGAMAGLSSGYLRGRYDLFIQRIIDAIMAFPLMLMALTLVAALGPSTNNVILAISVPMAPRMARVIRAATLTIRDSDFVTAGTSMGASGWRIMMRHILPNTMAPLIIVATAQLGQAIVIEAGLGFLGLGTQEPTPSWGLMLSGSVAAYAREAPWIPIIPGVALSVAVFAVNLLGDAMRDVLDPRLRRR